MSQEVIAALIGLGGVALGFVLGFVADRAWYWNRPRVSAETGQLARRSVNTAKRVFAAANATGGHLPYPWVLNDGSTVLAEHLDDDLRQAAARIGNDEFAAQVKVIQERLHGVWAATSAIGPQVFVLGAEETPAQREHWDSVQKVAAKQREQAESGAEAIEPALTLLDKLERHS